MQLFPLLVCYIDAGIGEPLSSFYLPKFMFWTSSWAFGVMDGLRDGNANTLSFTLFAFLNLLVNVACLYFMSSLGYFMSSLGWVVVICGTTLLSVMLGGQESRCFWIMCNAAGTCILYSVAGTYGWGVGSHNPHFPCFAVYGLPVLNYSHL